MRLLVGLLRRGRVLGAWIRLAWVDGQPSAVLYDAKGRVVSVVELDVADGVVRRSALWSTPASLVISDRCLMWRDCRPRRTPNSEPRSTVTQRTGIPSRTARRAVIKSSSHYWQSRLQPSRHAAGPVYLCSAALDANARSCRIPRPAPSLCCRAAAKVLPPAPSPAAAPALMARSWAARERAGGGSAVTCYRDVKAALVASDQTWVKEEHDVDEGRLGIGLDCGPPVNRWHG